ncbi:hypothetical protein Bbelb_082080 [Branchiostoma belcheri]|nr:hypothetical protein Bbelb_082080 [Branchiostoma belcheri]
MTPTPCGNRQKTKRNTGSQRTQENQLKIGPGTLQAERDNFTGYASSGYGIFRDRRPDKSRETSAYVSCVAQSRKNWCEISKSTAGPVTDGGVPNVFFTSCRAIWAGPMEHPDVRLRRKIATIARAAGVSGAEHQAFEFEILPPASGRVPVCVL